MMLYKDWIRKTVAKKMDSDLIDKYLEVINNEDLLDEILEYSSEALNITTEFPEEYNFINELYEMTQEIINDWEVDTKEKLNEEYSEKEYYTAIALIEMLMGVGYIDEEQFSFRRGKLVKLSDYEPW